MTAERRKGKGKERSQLKIGGVFMIVQGEHVQIDPLDPAYSKLQARCKLAMAEMTTGESYEIAPPNSQVAL